MTIDVEMQLIFTEHRTQSRLNKIHFKQVMLYKKEQKTDISKQGQHFPGLTENQIVISSSQSTLQSNVALNRWESRNTKSNYV